jgi:hypothetical protein
MTVSCRTLFRTGTNSVFPRGDDGLTRLQAGEISHSWTVLGPNHRSFTEVPEPRFDGWHAEISRIVEVSEGQPTVVAGMLGTFRRVTDKPPICRLDDIFEPTLGDVIQASGSEVLRFVPNEPGSLVSSPILFVQDQRHLIGK